MFKKNVHWIDPKLVIHSFGLILFVNVCVFKVSSENTDDLVLVGIPSNLLILHIFEPLSLILPWNKQVDNFIGSIVVFADRFLFNRGALIIVHVDDLRMLKEICSFLEATS